MQSADDAFDRLAGVERADPLQDVHNPGMAAPGEDDEPLPFDAGDNPHVVGEGVLDHLAVAYREETLPRPLEIGLARNLSSGRQSVGKRKRRA